MASSRSGGTSRNNSSRGNSDVEDEGVTTSRTPSRTSSSGNPGSNLLSRASMAIHQDLLQRATAAEGGGQAGTGASLHDLEVLRAVSSTFGGQQQQAHSLQAQSLQPPSSQQRATSGELHSSHEIVFSHDSAVESESERSSRLGSLGGALRSGLTFLETNSETSTTRRVMDTSVASARASAASNLASPKESEDEYSEYSEYEEDADEWDPEWHARQNQKQVFSEATAAAAAALNAAQNNPSLVGTERTQSVTDNESSLVDASIGASSTLFANRRDLRAVDQSVNLMDASVGNYDDAKFGMAMAVGAGVGAGGRVPRRARKSSKAKRESATGGGGFFGHQSISQSFVDIFLDSSDSNSQSKIPSFRRSLSRGNSANTLQRTLSPMNVSHAHQRRLFYGHSSSPYHSPATIYERHGRTTEAILRNCCKLIIILFMIVFIVIIATPHGTVMVQEKIGLSDFFEDKDTDNKAAYQPGSPTMAPTSGSRIPPPFVMDDATAQARLEALQDIILIKGLTSPEDLMQEDSAQYLAALWVAQMDPARLNVIVQENDDDQFQNLVNTKAVILRYAMATFYTTLGLKKTNHNKGDPLWNETKWKHNDGWLTERDVCDWYGVHCDKMDGKLVHLNLTHNNLHGSTLPSELVALSDLAVLDVGHNKISGPFPEWIGELTNLEFLTVSTNELTGTLPENMGNLTKMKELELSHNSIAGTLPTGLNTMYQLRTMLMDQNSLTGTIPLLHVFAPTLKRLLLNRNSLTGSVPPKLFQLHEIVQLELSDNGLNGTLPEFGMLRKMRGFSINNNQITGTLPNVFHKLTNLVEFGVANNHLRGSIPPSLGLATHLEYLLLDKNPLTGTIPHEFASFDEMVVFRVSETELTGSMPAELCELKSTRGVDMIVFGDCQDERFDCNCCDTCTSKP